jgi:hypothetical protein
MFYGIECAPPRVPMVLRRAKKPRGTYDTLQSVSKKIKSNATVRPPIIMLHQYNKTLYRTQEMEPTSVELLFPVLPPPLECTANFFPLFFTTHSASRRFNSRNTTLPLAASYQLRGGDYKDPTTSPCGILLRLSADTLFTAI